MLEIDMSADGFDKDGVRTYTIVINKKTHKGLTMEETIKLIREAEEGVNK